MKEKIIPVKTEKLGKLNGRDCIYIDKVFQDDMDNLVFEGEITGFLAEKIVFKDNDEIILYSSLPAKSMYLKRGYREYRYEIFDTDNGDFLCCDIMKKKIQEGFF